MQKTGKIYFSNQEIICEGYLNLANLTTLQKNLAHLIPSTAKIMVNGERINEMDTAGAWLLLQWMQKFSPEKFTIQLVNFPPHAKKLIEIVKTKLTPPEKIPVTLKQNWLTQIGKVVVGQLQEFYAYLAFIGKLSIELLRILPHSAGLRWKALFSSIYHTGYQALPIIGLLSFMIGVVLTYQMGVQLRNFGANIFIVDLLGLSILREFSPLLTAIMIAGRTGSAFTAELGLMKANQEIDALNIMGITPEELLLLPKIIGLFIVLPLLTIWSDIFSIFGGMVMANKILSISWHDFLHRFQAQIPLKTLLIGLGKAPIFALIIASIGCFQGISVQDNADSIGKNTTKSVVFAIFFIIVADALFSIIFSKLKI